MDLDDLIDQKHHEYGVKASEWLVLGQEELNEETLAKKKHEVWLNKIDRKPGEAKPKKIKKVRFSIKGQERREET